MATNFLDKESCTSNVVSLSSQPNSSSFQNSSADLVPEMTLKVHMTWKTFVQTVMLTRML